MKKILLGLVIISFTFSACNKCTTCTVKGEDGLVDSALEDIETCGNKDEVAHAEAIATAYADSIGGTAECFRQ